MNTHSLTMFAISLAIGASTIAVPASAQDDAYAAPTAHVSYADLDLRSEAGRKALDRRLRRAADAVCPNVDYRNLRMVALHAQCRSDALRGTEQQVAALLKKQNVDIAALAR